MSLVSKTPKTPKTGALRKDPKPRRVDGTAAWMRIENADPDRKYIFANRLDHISGLGYYLSLGARIEIAEPGGIKLKTGMTVKPGEEIEQAGQVLVSFSMERWREIQENGPDGNSGQAYLDEVESRILDRSGRDHLRGIGSRPEWMQFVNDTQPLAVE